MKMVITLNFKDKLKKTALTKNIEYINIISCEYENYNSVVVALLPYYAGEKESYISKYTMGEDYHILGKRVLESILKDLKIEDYKILVDVSPHNEKELALKAGLGVYGRNSLLINEKYGSYVFILTAFLNLNEAYPEQKIKHCINCGRCMDACPQKTIKEDKVIFENCLSHLTQKRNITLDEEKAVKKAKKVWGCDVCQDVCPLNKNASITPFYELKENLLLNLDGIDSLTNREFKEKYGKFSLSYKGKNILKRNINLIE